MAGTVSQYQQGAFTTPVDGTTAAASEVLSNDNSTRTKHNSHDADATIHVQSSAVASRPAAGTAERKWMSTDTNAPRLWWDSGSAWHEVDYLNKSAGGTVTGATTFATTLTVSSGGVTVTAGGLTVSAGGANITGTITNTGGLSVASGGASITGTVVLNGNLGFYNSAAVAKQTVSGSRGGNAALASLLTALATVGLVTDSSSA